ncbi:MAG TPA: hypothetical protein VHO25_10975 [Polyangiaceae bacterium]|nr:hypothetical protein [Polyangiaceae bacterium]
MRTLDLADSLVLAGKHETAVASLARPAGEQLAPFLQSGELNPTTLGAVAASFLSVSPVTREFAPYDLSLHSLARLEAALDVLFGPDPLPAPSPNNPLLVLLGQYIGEALRQAHQGSWEGSFQHYDRARVLVGHRSWQPFQLIFDRWQFGNGAPIRIGIQSALSQRDSPAWAHRIVCPIEPPMPWSEGLWPNVMLMPDLAGYVSQGIIARYCETALRQPLDGSMSSVAALDGFVGLIAPPGIATDPNEAWVRRIAVLLGAYLGEVLCRAAAGTGWLSSNETANNPDAYVMVLRNGRHAQPVTEILSRFGQAAKIRLSDYLRDVILASKPPSRPPR